MKQYQGSMGAAILCLIVLSIGLSAYARARRAGQWSWGLFALTVAGLLTIAGVATLAGLWVADRLGPDHVGLVTALIVGLIMAGVAALTFGVNAMTKRGKPSGRATQTGMIGNGSQGKSDRT
jgi:hypothetical protein